MQLNDLKSKLLCRGIILKRQDVNEEWMAWVSDFDDLSSMYVHALYVENDNLIIEIEKDPMDDI